MNFFRKLMYGRYGGDQLSIALMILSIVLMIILQIVALALNFIWIEILAYIPLAFAVFRIFSRNLYKRQQENQKFLKLWAPIQSAVKFQRTKWKDRKTHKYFTCPNCKAKLRVPRQGGKKLRITCTKCKTDFEVKA